MAIDDIFISTNNSFEPLVISLNVVYVVGVAILIQNLDILIQKFGLGLCLEEHDRMI